MLLTITLHCMWLTVSAAISGCGDMTSDGDSGVCSERQEDSHHTVLKDSHADFSLLDKVIHSMEELKALPGELKESILHVERRSLMVAGVVVAIGAAIMLLGCLWIHWCHTEHGEYVPLPTVKEEHEKKQHHHHQHRQHRDHSRKAGTHLDNGVKKVTHRRGHVVTESH